MSVKVFPNVKYSHSSDLKIVKNLTFIQLVKEHQKKWMYTKRLIYIFY